METITLEATHPQRTTTTVGPGGLDEEAAWRAVAERDRRFAFSFVFAVESTGVYCRPGCASRTPRRENVTFFGSAGEAALEGFRPCKRCRPDGEDPVAEVVDLACSHLEERLGERVGLEDLGREVGMSGSRLQRVFKERTGVSPREYVEALRVTGLKRELRDGTEVTRAMFEAGFQSASAGHAVASTHLGMTPATYGRGGAGARIRYALADCSLGRLLVARTDRGLCAVMLGDSDEELVEALRDEYHAAEIEPAGEEMARLCSRVAAVADAGDPGADIPLDVAATAFQWRVWRALRQIPAGETRTYGELAEMVGAPRASRAAGTACGTNNVCLVIPCHRVVRADGTPGGYRWGTDRKAKLLAGERERGSAGQ